MSDLHMDNKKVVAVDTTYIFLVDKCFFFEVIRASNVHFNFSDFEIHIFFENFQTILDGDMLYIKIVGLNKM